MKGWTEKKLGNTLVRFIDGDRSDRYPSRSEFKDAGVMFLNAESIKNGKINKTSVNFISQEKYETIRKGRIEKYDVLMTTRGNGIGDVAFVDIPDNGLINAQMLILRTNDEMDLFSAYLYYFLKTNYAKEQIGIFSSGSAQPQIPIRDLKHLPILYPLLPIQKKIAAILSAYDDLIENNNRRIAILEKMAEELYREWFVRLRFPGHEKVKIVKGVPEGWEVNLVEQAFEILGGGTPATSNLNYWNNGEINWYSPTDLTANKSMFSFESKQKITETGLKESSARLFPPYSIMMTSRATIGEISINTTLACTNQGFITCIPNNKLPVWYLVFWLKSNKQTFLQLANGATFLEITKGKFKKIPILIPPKKDIIDKYCFMQEPIMKQIEKILRNNTILEISRDRLLSRLMSGKIDVENMGIQFPASMQEEFVDA